MRHASLGQTFEPRHGGCPLVCAVLFLAAAGSSLTTPFRNKYVQCLSCSPAERRCCPGVTHTVCAARVSSRRFGRELLSLESTIPAYLLPTQLPPLCNGNNCCQEDDYSSAYEVGSPRPTAARAAADPPPCRPFTRFDGR